jgi:hypothetical protein
MPSFGDSMFMTYVHAVQMECADDKAAWWSIHISCDFCYIILETTGSKLLNSSQMKSAKRVQVFLDVMLCCCVVPEILDESNGFIFKG